MEQKQFKNSFYLVNLKTLKKNCEKHNLSYDFSLNKRKSIINKIRREKNKDKLKDLIYAISKLVKEKKELAKEILKLKNIREKLNIQTVERNYDVNENQLIVYYNNSVLNDVEIENHFFSVNNISKINLKHETKKENKTNFKKLSFFMSLM